MADDTEYPQDTYSGGTAVMSRLEPDGSEYIWDNENNKYVFVGKRDMSQPNSADATHALAQGLRGLGVPESESNSIVQLNPSPPLQRKPYVDKWLAEVVADMSPEAKKSMRPEEVAKSPDPVEPPPPSPMEQVKAATTLTSQMRREEAALMPPNKPIAPTTTQAPQQSPAMAAPVAPPQTGTQPMPQAPVLPPGGSPIAPPQPQMADPETIARLRAQRPVPGTRTPPSPASIQAYNLQMYQRAVAQGMPQKQAAQIYLGPMLAAQGQAKDPPHLNVSGVLYERNPKTGEWDAKTKPKVVPPKPEPRDMELQAELNDVRKRMFEVDKSVAKGDLTKEEAADLTSKYQDELDKLKDKYYKREGGSPTRSFGRGIGVLPMNGVTAPSGQSAPPVATTPASVTAPARGSDVKAQALAAIKKGADAKAVRARYKKLTGQDLE